MSNPSYPIDFSPSCWVWSIGQEFDMEATWHAMKADGDMNSAPSDEAYKTWPACLFDAESHMAQREAKRRGYYKRLAFTD